MTPALPGKAGQLDDEWQKFFTRLSRVQQFKELAQGRKEANRLEEALHLCWSMCADDRARLQKRLDELNLTTLKQVTTLKSQLWLLSGHVRRGLAFPGEHNVDFYEPLRYLSETARELVLLIVEERLQHWKGTVLGSGEESGGQWRLRFEEAEERMQKAEEREQQVRASLGKELEAAQQREEALSVELSGMREQMDQLHDEVAEFEVERSRMREERTRLERQRLKLEARTTELEKETLRLQAEKQHLEEELSTFREKLRQLEEELADAKEELEAASTRLAEAQKEVERAQEAVAELEARVETAEERLQEAEAEVEGLKSRCTELAVAAEAAEAKAREADAEAAVLREELERRNNTETRNTQTELTGKKLEEHLKVKNELEEMRRKLTELVKRYERQGLGGAIKEVYREVGLVLKARSCFDRLYGDAKEREARQERLREEQAARKRAELEQRFATWDQALGGTMELERTLDREESRGHSGNSQALSNTSTLELKRILNREESRGHGSNSQDQGLGSSMELKRALTRESSRGHGGNSQDQAHSNMSTLELKRVLNRETSRGHGGHSQEHSNTSTLELKRALNRETSRGHGGNSQEQPAAEPRGLPQLQKAATLDLRLAEAPTRAASTGSEAAPHPSSESAPKPDLASQEQRPAAKSSTVSPMEGSAEMSYVLQPPWHRLYAGGRSPRVPPRSPKALPPLRV